MRPVVTLSNGIRVCNFSSPHPFNFVDGSVLPACSPEQASETSLVKKEDHRPFPGLEDRGVVAVVPRFETTENLRTVLNQLESDPEIDVIIVPFPVLEAIRDAEKTTRWISLKAATICMADRITKAAHIDRFCR